MTNFGVRVHVDMQIFRDMQRGCMELRFVYILLTTSRLTFYVQGKVRLLWEGRCGGREHDTTVCPESKPLCVRAHVCREWVHGCA